MKKLLVLVLALCLLIPAAAVMAEDDEEISFYTEEVPEAAAYVSTWVAEDGDWRIEFFDEDGGIKLMVVHRLGDNQEDVWESTMRTAPPPSPSTRPGSSCGATRRKTPGRAWSS